MPALTRSFDGDGLEGRWMSCYKCKAPLFLTTDEERTLRRSGASFFCRWGHRQVFTEIKSEVEKERDALRLERDRLKQENARLDEARDWAVKRAEEHRQSRKRAERSAVAYRGVATKMKKRVAGGVCPCCNRTFSELAAHMQTEHPEFKGRVRAADVPRLNGHVSPETEG